MKTYLNPCIIAAVLLLSSAVVLAGQLDCTGCHAEKNDSRPIDSTYRNISSGGFMGNHRTHLSEGSTFNSCVTCHNNDSYTTSHLDGKIQLSMKINNYSGAFGKANYNTTRISTAASGMVFFNQTSVPVLATCSNVNCHLEATTPTWGSGEVSCRVCHGAPPAGISPAYSGGAAGSHGRHDSYFSGTANCIKCHSDHSGEPKPYAHATSAGKRALSIALRDPLNNPSGIYSNTAVIDYMPSQAAGHLFGSCSTSYCHSPGNRSTAALSPNKPAAWGGTLGCDGCHRSIPTSGSHAKHVETDYGVPVPCYKCHAATVNSANTITSTAQHVNMKVDVSFDSSDTAILGTYSGQIAPMQKTPGTGYERCGNVYCHSSGQGTGGTWPPTYSAPKWGDSATGKCGSCHDHGLHNVGFGTTGALLKSGGHSTHLKYGFGTQSEANRCGVCHYGTGYIEPDGACGQCHNSFSSGLASKHINHKIDVDFVSKFGGTYNGNPEPGNGYSNCSNIYCHSNGTSVSTAVNPVNSTLDWGTVGALACNGCHEYPPAYQNGTLKANSHSIHSSYGCATCHFGTTADGASISSFDKHVNKIYDLQPGPGVFFSYTFASGGGTCTNISCHGNNNAVWGATNLRCGNCHSISLGD